MFNDRAYPEINHEERLFRVERAHARRAEGQLLTTRAPRALTPVCRGGVNR